MEFRVNVTLKWAEIFNNKFDHKSKIKSEVAVSTDFYLIYAKLISSQSDNEIFDVCKLLNSSLDTDLPEDKIFVESAGFFTFGKFKNNIIKDKNLAQIFPLSPIPLNVARHTLPMDRSTAFWLSINLRDVSLFRGIIQIGANTADGGDKLSLSTLFESGEHFGHAVKSSQYSAELPTFSLFKLFEFKNTRVVYQFLKSDETSEDYLYVHGEISISLFRNRKYKFQGDLEIKWLDSVNKFDANIQLICDLSIDNIFNGDMAGIIFSDVLFMVRAVRNAPNNTLQINSPTIVETTEVWVQGQVQVGSINIKGAILLDGIEPVLAKVVVEDTLSISDVFNQCISTVRWPEDLINLEFLTGTELYYCKENYKPISNLRVHHELSANEVGYTVINYVEGFHLHARIVLRVLVDIPIEGDIKISSQGVTASIQLQNPINLYILKICAPTENQLHGPILCIQPNGNQNHVMQLKANLIFMQISFGLSVMVELKKIGRELVLKTQLETISDIGIFIKKGTKIAVSYSEKNGFKTEYFPPFDFVSKAFDLLKTIKKISDKNTSPCGGLIDFIFTDLIQTKFKLSISFGSSEDKKDTFIYLSGKYTILFKNSAISTINLENLTGIKINSNSDINNLEQIIEDALISLSESIVSGLLSNKEAITKVMIIFAGKNAAKYAATLVCQDIIDSFVAEALTIAVSSAAVGALLIAITNKDSDENIKKKLDELMDDTDEAIDKTDQKPKPNPDRPYNTYVKYKESTLSVHWGAGRGNTSYLVQLLDPLSNLIDEKTTIYDSCEVHCTVESSWRAGKYQARIKGISDKRETEWVPVTFQKLSLPENIVISIDSLDLNIPKANISWDSVVGVEHYELSTLHDGTSWRDTIAIKDSFLTVKIDDDWFEGEYEFTLRSIGSESTIPSSITGGLKFTRLPFPQGLSAFVNGYVVELSWDHVINATKYWAKIVDVKNVETLQKLEFIVIENKVSSKITFDKNLGLITLSIIADSEVDIPSLASKPIAISIPDYLSDRSLAQSLYKLSMDGNDCGLKIKENFKDISLNELAMAMAIANYDAESTGSGILAAFPETLPNRLAQSLKSTYSPFLSLIQKAWISYCENKLPEESASNIIDRVPTLLIPEMSKILATAGYAPEQTAEGLLFIWPKIEASELAKLLKETYQDFDVSPIFKR